MANIADYNYIVNGSFIILIVSCAPSKMNIILVSLGI